MLSWPCDQQNQPPNYHIWTVLSQMAHSNDLYIQLNISKNGSNWQKLNCKFKIIQFIASNSFVLRIKIFKVNIILHLVKKSYIWCNKNRNLYLLIFN